MRCRRRMFWFRLENCFAIARESLHQKSGASLFSARRTRRKLENCLLDGNKIWSLSSTLHAFVRFLSSPSDNDIRWRWKVIDILTWHLEGIEWSSETNVWPLTMRHKRCQLVSVYFRVVSKRSKRLFDVKSLNTTRALLEDALEAWKHISTYSTNKPSMLYRLAST